MDVVRSLLLPCGQCWGCKLERSRQAAVRCMHEAQMHEVNSYVTLTYSDECLPADHSLVYRDFQLFMKRLRDRLGYRVVRFYMCGEYGERTGRPHYHALLFGVHFADRVYHKKIGKHKVYVSHSLDDVWSKGYGLVGGVSFESAAYVARYVLKKITGPLAKQHYSYVHPETGEIIQRVPEFVRMSNGGRTKSGGIGAGWFARFKDDVYPEGKVVVNGRKVFAPRYYDKLFAELDPEAFAQLALEREMAGRARVGETSYARLRVREDVAIARGSFFKRDL